ncbi:hypothetical protein OPT61_g4125 [Boeremia exigua]|uniref:Uncharacterized protein n=1 Tax=Boeremia exigua TaxID=749465 RepID=A0ACC2IFD3_9PLEO|nr:hypothetical protein OPT61_g4125 [Boeremia exigua]
MDDTADLHSSPPPPADEAAAEPLPSHLHTAVQNEQSLPKEIAAEHVAPQPPPRLLDSDPSKFRSLKRVIVVGLPGSGIDGVSDALKKLGFKVYDFQAASDRYERDFPLWLEAARLRQEGRPYNKADFDKVIGDYDAIVGVPAGFFGKDFINLYSNVKVILLTTHSNLHAVPELCEKIMSPFWQRIDPAYFGAIRRFFKVITKSDVNRPININKTIREVVRKKNLLEIRTLIAWVPLCEFLGVPVPEGPAPELHDDTIKEVLAARPQRMFAEAVEQVRCYMVESLRNFLTMASVMSVAALAVLLGAIGLSRFLSYSSQLPSFLLSRSQVRDVTRLLAVVAASCALVCGFVSGYYFALRRRPSALPTEPPRLDYQRTNSRPTKRMRHGRGRQSDKNENARPERPTLEEWKGVQENIRKDDAEMKKEGETSFEGWKNGKHVTFHVTHKRTEAGQDLFSGPRKVVSVTEETVR